jgi:hypothetical protein
MLHSCMVWAAGLHCLPKQDFTSQWLFVGLFVNGQPSVLTICAVLLLLLLCLYTCAVLCHTGLPDAGL